MQRNRKKKQLKPKLEEVSYMIQKPLSIHRLIHDKVLARIAREKSVLKLKRIASFNGVACALLDGYGEGRLNP